MMDEMRRWPLVFKNSSTKGESLMNDEWILKTQMNKVKKEN